jgi:hypothetical protein
VGRIYQQAFIDARSQVATAKLYDRKTPVRTCFDSVPLAGEKMLVA